MNKKDFIILTKQGCNPYGLEDITYKIAVNKNNIETIRTINNHTYIHFVSGADTHFNEDIDKILELINEGETMVYKQIKKQNHITDIDCGYMGNGKYIDVTDPANDMW